MAFGACVCVCVCAYVAEVSRNATTDDTTLKNQYCPLLSIPPPPFERGSPSKSKTKDMIYLMLLYSSSKQTVYSVLFTVRCAFEHQEINPLIFHLAIGAIRITVQTLQNTITFGSIRCYSIIYEYLCDYIFSLLKPISCSKFLSNLCLTSTTIAMLQVNNT